jgi:hypothetical protein
LLCHFDEVSDNFEVASCYAFSAEYFISQGDPKKAAFFIRNSENYFNSARTHNHPRERFLLFLLKSAKDMMDMSNDLSRKFKLMTSLFLKVEPTQNALEATNNMLEPSQIDSTILDTFQAIDKSPTSSVNGNPMRLNIVMIAQGMKLQYYCKNGYLNNDIMLATANSLSDLVLSEHFIFCTQVVSTALVEAANVQMKIMVQDQVNLLDKLKLDLRGLQILADRYEIVNKWYGESMTSLFKFIQLQEALSATFHKFVNCS